jgi:hypothetical protein
MIGEGEMSWDDVLVAQEMARSVMEDRRRRMIPDSCSCNARGPATKPLAGCRWCGGSGRVDYVADDFPPGTNACCCTCPSCRRRAESAASSELRTTR